jgi:hypothetical protein
VKILEREIPYLISCVRPFSPNSKLRTVVSLNTTRTCSCKCRIGPCGQVALVLSETNHVFSFTHSSTPHLRGFTPPTELVTVISRVRMETSFFPMTVCPHMGMSLCEIVNLRKESLPRLTALLYCKKAQTCKRRTNKDKQCTDRCKKIEKKVY